MMKNGRRIKMASKIYSDIEVEVLVDRTADMLCRYRDEKLIPLGMLREWDRIRKDICEKSNKKA